MLVPPTRFDAAWPYGSPPSFDTTETGGGTAAVVVAGAAGASSEVAVVGVDVGGDGAYSYRNLKHY
jgi:1-aminocyclopropane-1-carboxylate deaminase/D-cysteine desulfhydrase-like pyridoxal-dependent ACC family enzyme